MIALLSLLAGGVVNILPLIIRWLEKREDIKLRLQLEKYRYQMRRGELELELDIIDNEGSYREGNSLRSHDISLDGGKFINALRASIRPVITYMFFGLFLVIKGIVLYTIVYVNQVDLITAVPLILWDESSQAIFGGIMGFWFGSRIIEKYMTGFKRRNKFEI